SITTAPSVITTATLILRPSGGCRAWATGPAASAITTSIMRTRTARIMRIMVAPPFEGLLSIADKDSPAGLCRKDKERTVSASLEVGAAGLDRTDDLPLTRRLLCH